MSDKLPDFIHLDKELALKNLDKDEQLLSIILNGIVEYKNTNLNNLDSEEYKKTIHDLKGISASAGAINLYRILQKLYDEYKNDDLISQFDTELHNVTTEIEDKLINNKSISFLDNTDLIVLEHTPKLQTILIVDDIDLHVQLLVQLLNSKYNILIAYNGKNALEIVKKNKVDLILLDIIMPDMDGFAVCTELKLHENTQDIPVIFITIINDDESINKAYSSGGVDYITKPFKPSEVLSRVSTHLTISTQKKILKKLNRNLELKISNQTNEITTLNEEIIDKTKKAQLGELISIIAHQWKQPLNAINVQIMLHNTKEGLDLDISKEDIHNTFEEIMRQVKFASETIDEFRNFFNPNKKRALQNLNRPIDVSAQLMTKLFTENSVKFIHDNIKLPTSIMIYSNELIQVLLNLLKNANEQFDNSKQQKDRVVEIIGYEDTNYSYIEIKDNAGGIPEDVLPYIFDKYFSTKGEKLGTGLGLDLCKTIVEENLNGTLSVINKDNGAMFTIKLKKGAINNSMSIR